MKKLLFFILAVVITTNTFAGMTHASSFKYAKYKSITGVLDGYCDPTSFEVKTEKDYMVFQTYNHWYMTHLVEGKTYRYFYTTDKYGVNKIVMIWK